MILIASLLMLAAGDSDAVDNSFGPWSTHCSNFALDSQGTVQCIARATIEDVTVEARRVGDEVRYNFTSSTCPSERSKGSLGERMFKMKNGASAGVDRVFSELRAFKTTCQIQTGAETPDLAAANSAFAEVISHRRPKK